MPRWIGFAVFLGVVLAVLAAIHLYLWWRLVRDPQLLPPWRAMSTLVLVLLAVSLPTSMALGQALSQPWRQMVAWPSFVWMGAMFILFVVLVGADLARYLGLFVVKLISSGALPTAETKLLLARTLAVAALGATLFLSGWAVINARSSPVIRDLEITLPGLAPSMDGTRIVLLSDIHLGSLLGADFAREVVHKSNALEPDIVAITGDLVDHGVDRLRDAVAPFADLRARHGVYFVTGNHEYYAGVEPWIAELTRLGMRVLQNEHVVIGDEEQGLILAGVNDPTGKMHPRHAPDVPGALAGRDQEKPVVLLSHQPLLVKEAAAQGVALQLSGHTHHGQIWPFNYAVLLQQPYVGGLNEHGPTKLYTSPGTGFWGPPMRLGSRSEITLIVLRAPGLDRRDPSLD